MKRPLLRICALLLAFGFGIAGAQAQTGGGSIEVAQAWARATPAGARSAAAYLTLVNKGTAEDQLTAASTPVAAHAQLHTTLTENGVDRMRPVAALTLKPGQTVAFKPGGYHLMLTGLKQPLKEGEHIPLTLFFAKAGKVETTATVEKVGAMGMEAMPGMDMGKASGMGGMDMGSPK